MKLGIIRRMRFPAWLLLVPATAFCAAVESLPAPTFADTEVSTNIPFAVSFDAMSRVDFSLSLDASPTNGVEVAIGEDADGDGHLSLDEVDFTVGYWCGKWFRRDAAADDETETDGPSAGRAERVFTLKRRKLDPAWNLVRVTRRGVAEIGEVVLVEGKKPGFAVEVR